MATTYTFTTKLSIEECKNRMRQSIEPPSYFRLNKSLPLFQTTSAFEGVVTEDGFWTKRILRNNFRRLPRYNKSFICTLRNSDNITTIVGEFKYLPADLIYLTGPLILVFVAILFVQNATTIISAAAAVFVIMVLAVSFLFSVVFNKKQDTETLNSIKRTLEATG